MTVQKPKAKQLLRPITTAAGSAMNQSQFLAITCNSLKAREKWRVHGAIGFGFGFVSHWLKIKRESFKPITKRSDRNHVITFESHLKTTLSPDDYISANWTVNHFAPLKAQGSTKLSYGKNKNRPEQMNEARRKKANRVKCRETWR